MNILGNDLCRTDLVEMDETFVPRLVGLPLANKILFNGKAMSVISKAKSAELSNFSLVVQNT